MSVRRSPTVFDSFNNATEGIIHVLRTQRNMRIHFAVAFFVIVAALIVNVTKLELIALCISITFVLIAEMLNTGIEAGIDIATTSFDPMAKIAKDIAAGAVLIASINALIVGYFVFSGKVADRSAHLLDRLRQAPAEITIVALMLTVIIVVATKAYTGRGTPLRGGLPSGHAALAFA
ncbi:MAG: diacylglycerol kinase, partial [Gaiellaceae bacterium]|nr:diacylglycerol kinase [Gaiellaceae bacterium]